MKVNKWGNSLAVRLPGEVVRVLGLEDGDDIDIHVDGPRSFAVRRKPAGDELLARVRELRGRAPADFHFDRLDVHER